MISCIVASLATSTADVSCYIQTTARMTDDYHISIYQPFIGIGFNCYVKPAMRLNFEFDGAVDPARTDAVVFASTIQGDLLRNSRYHLYVGTGPSVTVGFPVTDSSGESIVIDYLNGRVVCNYQFCPATAGIGVIVGADYRLAPHSTRVQYPYISLFAGVQFVFR